MNIGVTEISPRAVQRAAEKNFKSGYYCCEALMCTICDEFKLDVPKEVIAMSSGMAGGGGKTGWGCGADNLSEQANRDVSVAHSTEVCLHLECSSEEQSRTGQPIQRA